MNDGMPPGVHNVLRIWVRTIAAILAIGPREHASQLWQDIRYALRGMRT